jgi:hypothetical protein
MGVATNHQGLFVRENETVQISPYFRTEETGVLLQPPGKENSPHSMAGLVSIGRALTGNFGLERHTSSKVLYLRGRARYPRPLVYEVESQRSPLGMSTTMSWCKPIPRLRLISWHLDYRRCGLGKKTLAEIGGRTLE